MRERRNRICVVNTAFGRLTTRAITAYRKQYAVLLNAVLPWGSDVSDVFRGGAARLGHRTSHTNGCEVLSSSVREYRVRASHYARNHGIP